MAEYKQYITQIQENGNVMISEDVVAVIVAHALAEVEGLGSLGTKPGIGIQDFATKKQWSKSLKVQIAEDNSLTISCSLMIQYGYSVVDVAAAVQQSITTSLESMTGVKVSDVHVNVCGVVR
ncbi:MAG: Asp23/Gls24 family envelope stress response protein [Oscillospiraceae bacterium]|nr:Asp23/Gls24 family envelope stress response protein [Oscillospiraceae bacterium]